MFHLNFRKKLNPIKPLQQINLNNEILYMYKEIVQGVGGRERQRESQRERERSAGNKKEWLILGLQPSEACGSSQEKKGRQLRISILKIMTGLQLMM